VKTRFFNIEKNQPPYLIAEIGLNHNGSLDLARKTADEALRRGANAVKFQLYRPELFIAENAELGNGLSLREFFRQFTLKEDEWIRLSEHVHSLGMDFFCSVFDNVSLEFYLESLNPSLIKTASSDFNNRPLIEKAARSGLPLIVSTGASEDTEVEDLFRWDVDPSRLVLMHCVSSYPASPVDYNLKVLSVWQEKYRCPVALSDHTPTETVSAAAVALGASVIEKHFTLDKNLPGPDQKLSSDPAEFQNLARACRDSFESLGSGVKRCMNSEMPVREFGRRALYALKDIKKGDIFTEENIIPLRPGGNPGMEDYSKILGKKAPLDYQKGDRLNNALPEV